MHKTFLIGLCLFLLAGCSTLAPTQETVTARPTVSTATPIVVQMVTPTPTPKPTPTLEPTSMPNSSLNRDDDPSELGERTQSFSKDVKAVGFVYFDEFIGENPLISIEMAYMNGKWIDPGEVQCKYGSISDYISYLEVGMSDKLYIESDILNRDMVFYIYDGSLCLGTGRISEKPKFGVEWDRIFVRAEFKMDDPSIVLKKDKFYTVLMGKWNIYISKPIWETNTKFQIDLNGKGLLAEGVIHEVPDQSSESGLSAVLKLRYLGKTYTFDAGIAYKDADYKKEFEFWDIDGDGIMEMEITIDWGASFSGETISFAGAGTKPHTIFTWQDAD